MQWAGVAGDENFSALEHGEKGREVRRGRQHGGVRREFLQFIRQQLFTPACAGGEDDLKSGRGGQLIQGGPVPGRPFFLGLAGSQVAEDSSFRQESGGERVQNGIGANFNFQRAWRRDGPGRQNVQQAECLMTVERRG